ncbi:PREDICTED: uncharacterized protein LOC104825057 isoform X2 [Tarenaya hassleriana]|uniref:uncharacterized protein LOC104825057 isoform X2 n=1 Tax=Tarenaya hassleriana TaxID=28532 RepID=UPI00053C65C3|nr:PREDICTED: uncharacterized protein LOC104825057 isoform X2 [Tarenaya hassleriana]
MFGGGRGPMGGGRGMLRAAGRAMTRTGVANGGIQEPFSSSSSSANAGASNGSHGGCVGSASRKPQKPSSSSGSNNLAIAVSGSPLNFPVAANPGRSGGGAFARVSSGVYDDFEWVSEEGSDEEFVFGCVPSLDEVQDAVCALQQVFDGSPHPHLVRDKFECNDNETSRITSSNGMFHSASSSGSDLDWLEPSMQLCHARTLQSHGYDHVYNAFHLLQTEPSVQRMVVSLSSDKAVWDAVMNNEVVQEIRELYNTGISRGNDELSSDDTPGEDNPATDFIRWVFDNTKAKAMEVFEKILKLATEFFIKKPDESSNGKDIRANAWLEEKLRTSVLLSVVVLLVVIVSRASHRA